MDIKCTNCKEPWDFWHLKEDVSQEEIDNEEFVFGSSRMVIIKCPCCETEPLKNNFRLEATEMLADLLGDDEDGLACMLEDSEFMMEEYDG